MAEKMESNFQEETIDERIGRKRRNTTEGGGRVVSGECARYKVQGTGYVVLGAGCWIGFNS